MTEGPSVLPSRRLDRCLLVGDTTTTVPVPDGWLAVVVAASLRPTAADLLEPVRDATRTGIEGVLLLMPGDAAGTLAGRLGLPVVAPDGEIVSTPGGVLSPTGGSGWRRRAPGGRPVPVGPRWPAPAWQSLVPDRTPWPAGVVARPVPAGWHLSAAGAAPVGAVELAVAAAVGRPRLLRDPSVTGDLLAAALRAIPPAVRHVADLVPLGPGQGAGRAVAAAAAEALDEPVDLVNGVPLHTPGDTIVVFALDTTGRPVWPEPAWLLRHPPGGPEEVVASSPPQPALRALDPATYALESGWVVHLTGGGIQALPGGRPPDTAPPAATPAYRVVVGSPGDEINDLLWPPLSALFTALLTDIPAPVDLVVAGEASSWGQAAARELAERHPGGSGAAQPRPFVRAVPLPVPTAPLALPAGADRPARTRRMLLVAGAGGVVLLVVAGIAAAWPGRHDTGDGVSITAEDADPQTGAAPGSVDARPASASPRASRSASPSPGGPSGSVPAPSGTASVSASATSSAPPLVLDAGPDLASGRPTAEGSHTEGYVSGRITDGNPMTYWESGNNAFPQWVQVDLGTATDVGRVVLRLPPSQSWPARTQRVAVLGSVDGGAFTTLSGEAAYTFDPSSGQRATITFTPSRQRYVRLVFTGNTVQPAGQLSGVEIYRA
ncbi:hypothetical protein GCM10010399_94930 [Dactylosporangium fulvum]|uniref:discoidin domain-containing protein n=1 Tax=Dactylosporangium fulvum TaxID=53359 RepID=UPI0031DF511E